MADHPKTVTASMLYNLVQCPRRFELDATGNFDERDKVSAFVQLLWDRGTSFEQEVIEKLSIPFTNLSALSDIEKEQATLEAMERGVGLIYAGRIRADDLVGEPDLLKRSGNGYLAGDIKSGAGEEGGNEFEEGRPKKHYAVQLSLYTDILERLGHSAGRTPFVWDIHGEEITYELDAPQSPRNRTTLWEFYQQTLAQARSILSRKEKSLPALASICKSCHWYTKCTKQIKSARDLTLLPELGRSRRDLLQVQIKTIDELAGCDLNQYLAGRKTVFSAHRAGHATKISGAGAAASATERAALSDATGSFSRYRTGNIFRYRNRSHARSLLSARIRRAPGAR